MDEQTIKKIEIGKSDPRATTLVLLAKALGCSPAVFFEDPSSKGGYLLAFLKDTIIPLLRQLLDMLEDAVA